VKDFDIGQIKDFAYYAPRLLRIKTNIPDASGLATERVVPFALNPSQLKLHALWQKLEKEVGYVRIIILKARRQGMSTYVEGRIFHKVHTTPNTHAFIIAHDKDGSNTIFNMSKLYYEALPRRFMPMKRYSSKKELVFENPNEKTRFKNPGLRSQIEVFTANKVTSASGGGYSAAHFSEVAKYVDAENLIASTAPTIPDIPGSFIVYESTAFGRGGFFHDEWNKATAKTRRRETNFIPIFFSWLEFGSYQRDFNTCHSECRTEKGLLGSLDPEEKELKRKYKATSKQVHWRRHKILDLGNDIDLFHQEYPTTPMEAFISSGHSYFNRREVQKIIDKCVDPEFVGELVGGKLKENEDGPLQIWEKPEAGCEYVIGVDVGGGTAEGDASVMEVVKVPVGKPMLAQVAEWRDWLDPVLLGSKAIELARYYNNATLAPEVNNHGLATLNEIKNNYFNIYRWQYFDRYGKNITNKLGWETNLSTKPLLCDYTSACINAGILVVRSRELADEMMSFIKRPDRVGGAADEGCYDDRIMSFMISIFCLAHSHQSGSMMTELSLAMNPIVEEERPRVVLASTIHDLEFKGLMSEKADFYRGSDAWLNY
jgi:hypothetical protein